MMNMIFTIFARSAFVFVSTAFICVTSFAQKTDPYVEQMTAYQAKYAAAHEVVPKAEKKYFRFFPANRAYRVFCTFEKITDSIGFTMRTSANTLKHYYKYGLLKFTVNGTSAQLYVYQSKDLMQVEKYKDYLFVPFQDATTGDESYGSGRYLEFYKKDIRNNGLLLDFNKAYNPYCAYSPNYKCPIPPKENRLPMAIRAGEMNFAKAH